MVAVLHEAFDCVEKHRFSTSGMGRRLFHDAEQWFLAEQIDWPYSFESICGVLDLDSDAIRQRAVLRFRASDYSRHLTKTATANPRGVDLSRANRHWRLAVSEPAKDPGEELGSDGRQRESAAGAVSGAVGKAVG